nr:hypothetical protein CFP56_69111 [Quercus suber]
MKDFHMQRHLRFSAVNGVALRYLCRNQHCVGRDARFDDSDEGRIWCRDQNRGDKFPMRCKNVSLGTSHARWALQLQYHLICSMCHARDTNGVPRLWG